MGDEPYNYMKPSPFPTGLLASNGKHTRKEFGEYQTDIIEIVLDEKGSGYFETPEVYGQLDCIRVFQQYKSRIKVYGLNEAHVFYDNYVGPFGEFHVQGRPIDFTGREIAGGVSIYLSFPIKIMVVGQRKEKIIIEIVSKK